MKDGILLIIAGAACSLGAWIFWHFLGSDALSALSIFAFLCMAVDSRRLRKELRVNRSKRE